MVVFVRKVVGMGAHDEAVAIADGALGDEGWNPVGEAGGGAGQPWMPSTGSPTAPGGDPCWPNWAATPTLRSPPGPVSSSTTKARARCVCGGGGLLMSSQMIYVAFVVCFFDLNLLHLNVCV